jgi:hypothetical protein
MKIGDIHIRHSEIRSRYFSHRAVRHKDGRVFEADHAEETHDSILRRACRSMFGNQFYFPSSFVLGFIGRDDLKFYSRNEAEIEWNRRLAVDGVARFRSKGDV